MNKIFIAILATIVVFSSITSVFALTSQNVSANLCPVSQTLNLNVQPGTVVFGNVALGNINRTYPIQTVINIAGSSTCSGNVGVTADVADSILSTFFSDLLYFDSLNPINKVSTFSTTISTATGSQSHNLMLIGNTTAYSTGPKSATIIYTITGDP